MLGRVGCIAALVCGLGGLPAVGAPADAKADKLWAKAEQATATQAWDAARALFGQFATAFPGDPRAADARARCDGNAVLAVVPYQRTGPSENRIDVYGSADGCLSTGADQAALRSIVLAIFDEALVLPPYDAYWPYFNWHILHAASAVQGHSTDAHPTVFGGRHGSSGAGGDAWMDFNAIRPLLAAHAPDYDLFCAYVQGHNGWPSISHSMQCVGTANLRYWPRVLSRNRLDDGEVWNEIVLLPELQARFDRAWAAFQARVQSEKPTTQGLSVREWRARTAAWPVTMITGTEARDAVRGKRDRRQGHAGGSLGGRAFNTLNQYIDLQRYPDDMRVQDRPLPSFDGIPWRHWLLKGDPSVTVLPTLKVGYSETSARELRFNDDGTVELAYPPKKSAKLEKVRRRYGGALPDSDEIKRNVAVAYYCHTSCHLGGAALKGGVGASPHFCAVCREEAVRAIYRYVSPVDRVDPAAGAIAIADPSARCTFTVVPMKPLDHFLTVEWRLDGALQTRGTSRELADRASGRRVSRLPAFPSRPRTREYFDPAKEGSRADARQRASAYAHARTEVREHFHCRPADLAPGRHTVTVTVIDETEWVLWDPEELLTQSVEWTFDVPAPPAGD